MSISVKIVSILGVMGLAMSAAGQQPDAAPPVREGPNPSVVAAMPAIAQALGVSCNYCHLSRRGMHVPEPKKDIARAMMAMTRDINFKIQAVAGDSGEGLTEVQCVTCHRGVTVPGQLSDILIVTAADKGVDAAIAQYRDLRGRYYGRQSYDFGDDTLLTLAQRLSYRDADEAIAVLKVNLEFNPKSVRSYSQMANAFSRKLDDKEAIASLEKALEIEPDNAMVRGQLVQLKSYKRNRQ
jgi:tetratricopeptide (TPR) repeat protein